MDGTASLPPRAVEHNAEPNLDTQSGAKVVPLQRVGSDILAADNAPEGVAPDPVTQVTRKTFLHD